MANHASLANEQGFFKQHLKEEDAIEYLERRRWKNGVACPHCSSGRVGRQKDGKLYQCKDCQGKFTVRTGTIFEYSHITLNKWLHAMYLLQTNSHSISIVRLSEELEITPKNACFILRRLQEALGKGEIEGIHVDNEKHMTYESDMAKRKDLFLGRQATLDIEEKIEELYSNNNYKWHLISKGGNLPKGAMHMEAVR